MKTLTTLVTLTSALIGLSAQGASVAADQALGERYESPTLGPSEIGVGRPGDERCDALKVQVVSYYARFPMFQFGQIKLPLMYSTAYGDKYIESKWAGADSGATMCRWDQDRLAIYLQRNTPVWRDVKRGLILDRMTADGTGMEGRAFVQGKDIAKITGSKSDTYEGFVTFRLKSCLTDRGDTVTSFSDLDAQTTDVRDLIRNLRTRGYRQFLKCNLAVSPKNYDTDTLTDGEMVYTGYVDQSSRESYNVYRYELAIQSTSPDQLYLRYLGGAMADQFARKAQPRDAAREQVALKAMKDFVSFINNDYANLLYSLNNVKVSQAERNEAIRAFFDKNKSKIKDLLGQVDDNYADVSLMNKVSMMISVQDSYRTIDRVERSITSSSPISLDQVVHQ